MKKYFWISIVVGIGILLVVSACQKDSYEKRVEKELASGERYDSLFLGLKLGMTNEAFFTTCWELNKQQLIKQGEGNTSVEHKLAGFKDEAYMHFYPTFVDGKISEMPMGFTYKSWSPWNTELHVDTLQKEVLNLFEKWYGKGFVKMKKPNNEGPVYVKVDGNRRITVYHQMDNKVRAYITDLSIEKSSKERATKTN